MTIYKVSYPGHWVIGTVYVNNILIIEYVSKIARTICLYLEQAGFEVGILQDGAQTCLSPLTADPGNFRFDA